MIGKKYRDYFSIDPEYFPQATEELINLGKVDWKKFYPHETFVKLLKDAITVLTRQQKLCLWVEGAYGTGKSHAVLTLKKLLEVSEEETRTYFDNYEFLSADLFNKLQGIKNQGKILAIHRYGSYAINTDRDLIIAIQESIKRALQENNLENKGQVALKESVINWLSVETNKNYFNALIQTYHKNEFDSDSADSIIEKLKTYSDDGVINLMNKVFAVADQAQITALKLDMNGLIGWIKSIIEDNQLKAIMFIWDEFTAYFQENLRNLTGFQQLTEISATNPFYLCIVTHKSTALFDGTDKDQRRILDRFVSPICHIELPENMAFRLMGQAMEKKDDEIISREWKDAADYLNDSLRDSRKKVVETAKITEKELMGVLPIHPSTALLLKHISSAFDSNQRSMFDFIKSDRGDEIKGFQWFIDHCGPDADDPLLTVDMLWDFFYEKGKDNLAISIRNILDSYHRQNVNLLMSEEKKVLKTVLILQAISQRVGDKVDLFIPNEKNLCYVYEGSQLDNGRAVSIANKLVKEQVLYKKMMGQNKFQYSVVLNVGDGAEIDTKKEELSKSKKTKDLVNEVDVSNALELHGALALRYFIEFATVDNFKQKINELRNKENQLSNKLLAVVTFAKNDEESASLSKSIQEAVKDETYHMLFIDASITPLGADAFDQYIENMAYSDYHNGKDNSLSMQFGNMAKDVLKKWQERIRLGSFILYSFSNPTGKRLSNIEELSKELSDLNSEKYYLGLEQFKVTDSMYTGTNFKLGAECGIKQETRHVFKSGNVATKLENAFSCAWKKDKYWEQLDKQNESIIKTKIKVDDIVQNGFRSEEGRISIAYIYDILKAEPFGFMPCNLTAFTLGFLLKEYANDKYRWTDDQTSEPMSVSKLQDMIDEIIKFQVVPNSRYKNKYIVAMTAEEKKFSEVTSQIFGISLNQCGSIQQTRDHIRIEMKKLYFPIWCLKNILDTMPHACSVEVLEEVLEYYIGIANTNNSIGRLSEADMALKIGKLCIENEKAVDDLAKLIKKENCIAGMRVFIETYKDGELITVANEIGAESDYLTDVKSKFDAEASNWVWNIETAKQKIDEVIVEYKIIVESNKINSKVNRFNAMIQEWCNKLGFIRISYEVAKPHIDDVKPLLEMLVNIKKSSSLADSQKAMFLNLLQLKIPSFKEFFNNQKSIFKEACTFFVEDMSDEEIEDVFKNIPNGVFTKDKSEYLVLVQNTVEEYKKTQGKRVLKELWQGKTDSNTPKEWSLKYSTPILAMVPESEVVQARAAFSAINRLNPDNADIQRAIEYLEKATFFDSLNDTMLRDQRFMLTIVKSYAVMLPEVDDVRNYLNTRVSADPYDWFANVEVENKIRAYAEAKYNTGGSNKALAVIESMDEEKVKDYLKRLIKDNMTVGIEIIKNE